MSIVELLARISLAFTRTVNFVMKGAFGDVVLSDLGIIAVVGGLFVFIACIVASIRELLTVLVIGLVLVAAVI